MYDVDNRTRNEILIGVATGQWQLESYVNGQALQLIYKCLQNIYCKTFQLEEAFADQRREEEKHKIEEEKRRERERMEEMKRQEQYRILEVGFVQQKCSCFTPKIK